MVVRDDEHAREHFAAACEMLRYESDRLSSVFAAFLLANTFLMGFLLHATTSNGGFPGEPGTAIIGGVGGICVSLIWLAAYERNTLRSGCVWREPGDGTRRVGTPDRASPVVRPGPGSEVRRRRRTDAGQGCRPTPDQKCGATADRALHRALHDGCRLGLRRRDQVAPSTSSPRTRRRRSVARNSCWRCSGRSSYGLAWLAWARIAAQRFGRCDAHVDHGRDVVVGRSEVADVEVGVAAADRRACARPTAPSTSAPGTRGRSRPGGGARCRRPRAWRRGSPRGRGGRRWRRA